MGQKSFKFKESLGKLIFDLSDVEAGQLVKGICSYYFEGKAYHPTNPVLRNCFIFIKTMLDEEEASRQFGKLGAQAKKQKKSRLVMVTKITKEGDSLEENQGKSVAKKSKK